MSGGKIDLSQTAAREYVARFGRKDSLALASLTLSVFVLVFGEFLPTGILPQLAGDLGISEGAAGQTVSATALAGMIAALCTAVIIRRADRRHALLGLAALTVIGNAVPMVATDLTTLVLARVATGVGVGGFWALSAGVVGRLFSEGNFGRAMGIIMSGVSVATIAAPPTGAFISALLGWRAAFGLGFGLSMIALIAQALTLPRLPASEAVSLAALGVIIRRPRVIQCILTVIAIAGGHFASYTYISVVLQDIGGLEPSGVAATLLAYGICNFAGSLAGAAFADKRLHLLISCVSVAIGASTIGILMSASHLLPLLGLVCFWGFAFGAAPIALMTLMTRAAPDSLEGVGSLFTATFQISVATGAMVGGLVVNSFGVSYALALTAVVCSLAVIATAIKAGRPK